MRFRLRHGLRQPFQHRLTRLRHGTRQSQRHVPPLVLLGKVFEANVVPDAISSSAEGPGWVRRTINGRGFCCCCTTCGIQGLRGKRIVAAGFGAAQREVGGETASRGSELWHLSVGCGNRHKDPITVAIKLWSLRAAKRPMAVDSVVAQRSRGR